MINPPKTLEEAENTRYGQWAGFPPGYEYMRGKCAYKVFVSHISQQCSRKNGHGPDGLYCKQHAKALKVREG